MHDRTHPFLQQVPLTVSPFVNLPTATTLPYRYKPMPSTLPPSILGSLATVDSDASSSTPDPQTTTGNESHKPKYVTSPSGQAAHPDDILASCRALHDHVSRLVAQAERDLAAADERIRARELAEKRRVAPGWLDSDARLLEPERPAGLAQEGNGGSAAVGLGLSGAGEMLQQQQQQQQYQSVQGWSAGYGDSFADGTAGLSEMEVPDTGEQLDRAFGSLGLGGSRTS
ncbi:hypothetical protein VTJ49DRAFT_5402 [Mycothermus thermophilus]|uniref:Uncharacterized protein n=1 Tax=Humicola insolens TaxID=85995 RepID=A0ABR3V3D0_HUMIN